MSGASDSITKTITFAGLTLEEFQAGVFDPGTFDHREHVYVGWRYLARYPLTAAIQRFTDALRRLTTRLGLQSKYRATVSWFFLIQIASRRNGRAAECWQTFASENPDLLVHGASLLRRYYAQALLDSQRAKDQFVLPDLPSS